MTTYRMPKSFQSYDAPGRTYSSDALGQVVVTDPTDAGSMLSQGGKALATGLREANGFSSVMHAVRTGDVDVAVIGQGDSTGNGTNEWFDRTHVDWLAARAPASMRVQKRYWDDTAKDYTAWIVTQAGTSGERGIQFGGTRSRVVQAADITQPANIDVSVKAAPADWTPAATQTLICHYGAAPLRGWRLYLRTDGRIGLDVSSDGTTQQTFNSSTAPVGVVDGSGMWLRATYNASTGAWAHYYGTDGVTWTSFGTGTGTALAVFAPAWKWELGGRAGTTDPFIGTIYEAIIRSDINAASTVGYIINPQPISSWQRDTGRIVDNNTLVGSPTFYILNGFMPGAGITGQLVTPAGIGTYLLDYAAKMVPPYLSAHVLLCTSHNEGAATGRDWLSVYATWVSGHKTRLPYSRITAVTENPESGTDTTGFHALRIRQLLAYSQQLGVDVVDTYARFFADGALVATLLDPDGIHPAQPDGHLTWANVMIERYAAFLDQ